MSTQWVVSSAAERVALDDHQHSEITFTISNPAVRADRVVFEVVPGEGADRSWFSVADPQRVVPGTGSVVYLVEVTVPPTAPAGSYAVQGRAYSADVAPEESSVLSGRVLFDVAAAPASPAKRRPWWLLALAALVAVVIGVVTWLVVAGGGTPKPVARTGSPTPGASASASVRATPSVATSARVPNLVSLTEQQATTELASAGLAVGTIKHKHDPTQAGRVVQQATAATTTVAGGSKVDLVVAVSLAAPAIYAPGGGATFGRDSRVQVQWNQTEPWVGTWRTTTTKEYCYYYVGHDYRDCRFDLQASFNVVGRSATVSYNLGYQPLLNIGWYNTGNVQATVTAFDDLGNQGPSTTVQFFIG